MYTFIVNPNARTGLGLKVWNELEAVLAEKNIRYQVFLTKYQKHAGKIARELTSGPEQRTIIILGGDGTINEVLNGICDLSKVTLGYIPIGSSNDFARGMHLSGDPRRALDRILAPSRFSYLNVGTLRWGEQTRRFAVSSGFGFDAQVCHYVATSRLKAFLNRLSLGKLCYLGIALKSLLFQTPKALSLTLDGKETLSFDKVYLVAFMNQKYEGGGFMFCPAADPSDDFLDVMVVEGLSKFKILFLLPTAFLGKHTRFRGIHIRRCRRVQIKSQIALPLHTDGEPLFAQTEAAVALEEEKVRFIIS